MEMNGKMERASHCSSSIQSWPARRETLDQLSKALVDHSSEGQIIEDKAISIV